MEVCVLSQSVMSDSLWPHELYVAHQAPPSMGFSMQECWSGLPFPSQGISRPRDEASASRASCFGRWSLCASAAWEALRKARQ